MVCTLKKKASSERAGPRVAHAADDEVEHGESSVEQQIAADDDAERRPPRYAQERVIEVAQPGRRRADHVDVIARFADDLLAVRLRHRRSIATPPLPTDSSSSGR